MSKTIIVYILMNLGLMTQCSQKNEKLPERFDDVVKINEQAIKTNRGYTVIRLDSLTDFEWDTVYFFSGNTGGLDAQYVSEQIGFDWQGSNIEDNFYRLLFTKSKQVVSYSDLRKERDPIYFYGCGKADIDRFSREEAVFASFAHCDNNGKSYIFISMDCIDDYKEYIADKYK